MIIELLLYVIASYIFVGIILFGILKQPTLGFEDFMFFIAFVIAPITTPFFIFYLYRLYYERLMLGKW